MKPRRLLFALGGLLAGMMLGCVATKPSAVPGSPLAADSANEVPGAASTNPPTVPRDPNTRIVFPNAMVNGQPARLFLDTGSEGTLLFPSITKRLGLKVIPPTPEPQPVPEDGLSELVQLKVGAQNFTIQLPVASGNYSGDGLIGWSEVRDNILVFDAPGRTVRAVADLPAETAGWMKLKVNWRVHLVLDTPLPNGKTGTILVDTGSPFGVALPPAQYQEWRAAHPQAPSAMRTYSMIGARNINTEEAWADEITVGGITLTQVPVREANRTELANSPNFAGSLGLYALKRMDLVVDGKNGFAYLQPKPPPGPSDPAIKPPGAEADPAHRSAENDDWTVADNVRLADNQLRAHAYVFAGGEKEIKGDYDGAIAELDDAIKLDPKNFGAYFDRGGTKAKKNDFAGAIADLDCALELDPENVTVVLERAEIKARINDFAGAIADFDHLLELDPKNVGALSNRAVARENKGDLDGAVADFSQAIELNPNNMDAYVNRAGAQEKKGDHDGAMADYAHAIDLDAKAYAARASAQIVSNPNGAITDFTEYLKFYPQDAPAYAHRAGAKYNLGDYAGAVADFSQSLELRPKDATTWLWCGLSHSHLGDFPAALADYTHALEFDPKNTRAYESRAEASQIQGDFAAAMVDYDKVIELKPDDSISARLYRQTLLPRLDQPPEDFAKVIADWKDGWLKTIGQFLAGSVSEADFLAAAAKGDEKNVPDQQCEAFYFAGMMRLSKEDAVGARDLLQKCVATDVKKLYEYELARAELARLDADKSAAPAPTPPATAPK